MLQEDGQSMAFYNLSAQRRDTGYTDRSASVSPVAARRGSVSSGHSLDSVEEAKSFVDAEERLSSDNDMVCRNCAARTFNAFKVQSGPHKGETKLRCSVYVPCASALTSGVNMFMIDTAQVYLYGLEISCGLGLMVGVRGIHVF